MVVIASSKSQGVSLEMKARRLRLGMSVKGLAERAGINRATLSAIEAGQMMNAREATLGAITTALDRLEQEMGMKLPDGVQRVGDPNEGEVEFRIEGVVGRRSVIVKGPIGDIAALQAAVQGILAGMRADPPERTP